MNTFSCICRARPNMSGLKTCRVSVGEDDSGSFGILPEHARMMTLLVFGLARFRVTGQHWDILGFAGRSGLFRRWPTLFQYQRYLRGKDYESLSAPLRNEFVCRRRSVARNKTEHAPAGRRNAQALVENPQTGEWSHEKLRRRSLRS